MNNNQQFDDNINDRFENYSPPVPSRIWENIVKERDKRKPVGFWISIFNSRTILLLTAFGIAGGSGAYLLLKKSAPNKENIIAVNAKQNSDGFSATASIEKFNINPDNNPGMQIITALINNNAVDTDSENTSANAGSLTTATGFKIKSYSPFVQYGEYNLTSDLKEKKKTTTDSDYDISDADLVNYNEPLQNNFLKRLLFFDVQKKVTDKKINILNKTFLPSIYLPDCPSIEKNASGNKTYIEVYGGPDIAFSNLSDTGNSAYLQKRKESTKFSSAYSAGIRFTKVFNNSMSLRTGVNFSQINEKFSFVQGNLVQITYIIAANGDTTGSYITTGTRYKTTINKFRTIDVPVLMGYELGNGRIHANINAGAIVNVYSWQKGDVLDASYNPISITTGKTNSPYQFKTNIGVGFMAAASVYYKINEKIHVLAEPYFRYSLTPMSKENLTLKQKYNTAGIRVGLRVDLH